MFHIYVHLRDAKFVVLIDPNATFEQLKKEIFFVYNRCYPGLDLPSVSVIRNLCDHNGYTIADHYQISYVIEDYSVLLAIVDHESAMCSQGIIGFQGIEKTTIQGNIPSLSAQDNQNPPWQSSLQHVDVPLQPSFLLPDSSISNLMRCPVAVNDVPCQSVLLKPVNGSRKRRSNHKKSSHDSTSHKIGVKMWKRKKVNSSIHSCGTSISNAESKWDNTQNEKDLKSVSCAKNVAPSSNPVGCESDVPPHISITGAFDGVKASQNSEMAKPKINAQSLSSKDSCIPSTNNAKSSAVSSISFLPAEISDLSSDSQDEHRSSVPAASESTKSSSVVPVKPNKKAIADVRKAVKKVIDPVLNASSSNAPICSKTTKGRKVQRDIDKNVSGSSVKLVDRVFRVQPVRDVKSFLPSTSDDDTSDSSSSEEVKTICSSQTTKGLKVHNNNDKNVSGSSVTSVDRVLGDQPVRDTKSFLPSTSDDTSDSDSDVHEQSHGKIPPTQQNTLSSDNAHLPCSDQSFLTSQVILSNDNIALTSMVDNDIIDNNSSTRPHCMEQSQHFTQELYDVMLQNARNDGTHSTDVIAKETQRIPDTQLDELPSPEIPLVNYGEKASQGTASACTCSSVSSTTEDEIRFERENTLPRARFLQNEKNEKQKTNQLSEKTDKEAACRDTCVNLSVSAQGRSIVGSSHTTETPDQKEHNVDATKAKIVHNKVKIGSGKTSRRGKSSHNIVNAMPQQQDVYGSAVVDVQSSVVQDVVDTFYSECLPQSVADTTKCTEVSNRFNDATVSTDLDDNIAIAGESKGRRCETKKDDPFDFVDDALLDGPLSIRVQRSGTEKKRNCSVVEGSFSDVEQNSGLAILVEDAKKCTPKNKEPTNSRKLLETIPNVKLSSAVFSLTPSTSTRKKGKQFTLERNRATVTKVAHSAPEQNFHVNQLSQEEIRFSHDASENLSKLFDNELWQRQS